VVRRSPHGIGGERAGGHSKGGTVRRRLIARLLEPRPPSGKCAADRSAFARYAADSGGDEPQE